MIIIHSLVLITLLQSALPPFLIILILIGLLFNFTYLIQKKTLLLKESFILYQKKSWYVWNRNNNWSKYDQATVCFDAGLFILVRLCSRSARKTLIIFNDQITPAEKRFLKLNEKYSRCN